MEWNPSRPFGAPRPVGQTSFTYLYNCNNDHCVYPPAAGEMKHMMEMNQNEYENMMNQEKKKRLTNEQLEALENTFQEEKKLDPDTKMKLSHELGLQPRQIAVWFQNRRARWKTKQLESLYNTLKQEFEIVSREKQKLQQEVLALRTILKKQVSKRQGEGSNMGYTYMCGEETVESTSDAAIRTTTNNHRHHQHQAAIVTAATTGAMTAVDSNNVLTYDPATSAPIPSYSNWGVLPSYP